MHCAKSSQKPENVCSIQAASAHAYATHRRYEAQKHLEYLLMSVQQVRSSHEVSSLACSSFVSVSLPLRPELLTDSPKGEQPSDYFKLSHRA